MVVGLGPLSWEERPPALALVDGMPAPSSLTLLVPIPAKHVAIIFHVCHLSGTERAAFLEACGRAHPGRLRAPHREARTRNITLTVPDLGDDKKNRSLEQLVVDFAARLARYAESVG
jgi:hypothetical protein